MQESVDQLKQPQATTPLSAAADRYRTLFTAIDEGYGLLELLYDDHGQPRDWRIVEVNPAFERLTGLRDTVGKTARELNPATEPSWVALLDAVARTGEARRFEHHAAGLDRWFEVYASRVGGDGSHTLAVVFNNVTERKQAVAALAERARLLDLSNDAIIVRDMDNRITYWNHGATELYGWTPDEAIGQDLHTLLRTEFEAPLADLLHTLHQYDRMEGEVVQVTRDGRRITALCRWSLDRDTAGQPRAILTIYNDITARKQAEVDRERLLHQAEQARVAVEAALATRDHFLAVAAHELRTPLTSLMGYTELLHLNLARGTDTLGLLTDRIRQQTHRLNGLINQLFSVARLERGQFAIEHQRVDLVALAAQVVDDVRATLPPDPPYTVDLVDADGPVVLDGDSEWLAQVLHNLLSNAVKYSPAGGQIWVRVKRTATAAMVEVEDHGIGIPAAAQAHLFDMFYRAPNVGAQVRGFGLGLHIVKEIIERHAGHIAVESREGAGSTFRIMLPLHAREHAPTQGTTSKPA